MDSEVKIYPQIFENVPQIKFYKKEDKSQVIAKSVILNESGEIAEVLDENDVTYSVDDLLVYEDFLNVPGIGYVKSGSTVKVKGKNYVLLFGWHTNVSNQTIYSWFLREPFDGCNEDENPVIYKRVEDTYMSTSPQPVVPPDRTLYADMVCDIESVTV